MGNECAATYCPCYCDHEDEEEHLHIKNRMEPEGTSSSYVMDTEQIRLKCLHFDKIEKSKYATMWRNIVNNSMVGTGIVCQAAIVSQDGHVLAASKGLDIKKPQIQLLSRAIHQNPGELAVTGIVLGEENFMYTRSEYGQAVYGVDESGERGCVVCSSKRCLIMGIYDKKPEAANTLVEELAEYIRGRDL